MSMQALVSASLGPPAALGSTPPNTSAKIRHGATDFEALLLGQMLKSAREAGGGGISGDGDDENEANSSLIELGEQQFAQALAANGGLGIAKLVVAGLTTHADR
jgi:Rod binding domain-containing protein